MATEPSILKWKKWWGDMRPRELDSGRTQDHWFSARGHFPPLLLKHSKNSRTKHAGTESVSFHWLRNLTEVTCSYAAKTRMFNAYPRGQVKIWLQLTTEQHGFELIPGLASILNTTRIHRYNTKGRELITNYLRTFDHVGRSVPWTPVLFEGPLHFKIPQQWSPTKACNRCHC